jgi:SPP1 gp7 family putative phage head morphogenesis protein
MPSVIDQRIASRLHQGHVDFLDKTDLLADRVGKIFDALLRNLLLHAVDPKPNQHQQFNVGLFTSKIQQSINDTKQAMADALPGMIEHAHKQTASTLKKTIPKKWWNVILPHTKHRRMMREDTIPISVTADIFNLTPEEIEKLTPEEYMQLVDAFVFKPLPRRVVNSILMAPGAGGLTWADRIDQLSKRVADPSQLARSLATGISSGETVGELRERIQPQVDNYRASAERIARTESRRVAESSNLASFDALGDMIVGMQYIATMDSATRPTHAARNGKIYHKQPSGQYVADDGERWPNPPWEPNCRCFGAPVLKQPKEFEQDPRVKAEFETAAGKDIPDPAAYTHWFASATPKNQMEAVGKRRFQVVAGLLGDTTRPEWVDFIDPEGNLMPISKLKKEKQADREKRKFEVNKLISEREQLFSKASATTFTWS